MGVEQRKLCVVCGKMFRADLTTCPDDGGMLAIEATTASGGQSKLGHVLGNYRLQRVIGEGGVGTVYEGVHVTLGRKMALKVLHPDSATPETIKRFFNEARAVNEIRHPNIIEVEDFVTTDAGDHYMLMELLEGEDLRSLLAREGLLSTERVVAIGEQIASALGAVHKVGIIHRDLKPDNIFVHHREGREIFKLLDFGIAKFLTEGQGVTRAGMTLGTPEYMAPEQIVTNGAPGPRTDIYALGVLMYECLCGQPPFTAPATAGVLRGHISEPVVAPSVRRNQPIPAVIESAVLKCLEKDPNNRFGSGEAVRVALRSAEPIQLPRAAAATVPKRKSRVLQMVPAFVMAAAAAVLHFTGAPAGASAPAAPVRPQASGFRPQAAEAPKPAPAPAPAPTPTPTPTPTPAPATINLALESEPTGAALFLGEDRAEIGKAPTTVALTMSSDPIKVYARFADGHEIVQSVVPDRELPTLHFVLSSVAAKPTKVKVTTKHAPAAPAKEPCKSAGGKDDTIDPFGCSK